MKSLSYVLLAACMLFTAACTKGDSADDKQTLTGKWNLKELDYSIGGPLVKETATGDKYVQFNADGQLQGNEYIGYIKYNIKDGTSITLIRSDNSTQEYSYKISHDTLTMRNKACFEQCEEKFVKQK